ncbi:hypothetical protein GCM10007931_10750 [Vibrio algivorus]|uniref:Uncharacterized protein n=1 Tax=Vibrio algivorus TaxID=1667024 RepID=A0ABQ6EMV7_9VIBR|nr:hypothetical protein GCM10007931_10750 [Vibrio algivorus]
MERCRYLDEKKPPLHHDEVFSAAKEALNHYSPYRVRGSEKILNLSYLTSASDKSVTIINLTH